MTFAKIIAAWNNLKFGKQIAEDATAEEIIQTMEETPTLDAVKSDLFGTMTQQLQELTGRFDTINEEMQTTRQEMQTIRDKNTEIAEQFETAKGQIQTLQNENKTLKEQNLELSGAVAGKIVNPGKIADKALNYPDTGQSQGQKEWQGNYKKLQQEAKEKNAQAIIDANRSIAGQ